MCTLSQGERGLPGLPGDVVSTEIEPIFKLIFTVECINPGPLAILQDCVGPAGLLPTANKSYSGLIGYPSERVGWFFSACPLMNLELFQSDYSVTVCVIKLLFLQFYCCEGG